MKNYDENEEEIQEVSKEELELQEIERKRKEEEEVEIKRIELLRTREKAFEKLQGFFSLKKTNLITSAFNSVKCNANKIRIQESFADELFTLNLKRSFLFNLKQAAAKSKFRFKLMRNFVRILRLNLRERIRVEERHIFQKMKKVKPKPFHRTTKRSQIRKDSNKVIKKNSMGKLEKENKQEKGSEVKTNNNNKNSRVKSQNKHVENLEKIKNSKLKQTSQNPQNETNNQRNKGKTKRISTSRNNQEKPSKSQNLIPEGSKTSRNTREKSKITKSRKLNKKSKSTLELNKKSKSVIKAKVPNRMSLEKEIIFDNSKQTEEIKLNSSKSSDSLNKEKTPEIPDLRRKSRKIPKLEGFGSLSKAKKSSRNFIADISSKNGEEFGKSFDLFEGKKQASKDYKVDLFGVNSKKEKASRTDRGQFRRKSKRELCGDELESISIDLRKLLTLYFLQNFITKNNFLNFS